MHLVTRADAIEAHNLVEPLAALLLDAVDSGASVSFLAGLTLDEARTFMRAVVERVAAGTTQLIVARDADGALLGSVQLVLAMQPNQPHRADVAKLLVDRRARRRGVGAALMMALEEQARLDRRSLLVLDTVEGGDGARLYERLGWIRVGAIPGYALSTEGALEATVIYYKTLGAPSPI
jgi:GNAT superfamily N-acetyltransferase